MGKKIKTEKRQKNHFKIDEIILVLIVVLIAIFVSLFEKSQDVEMIEAEKIITLVLNGNDFSFAKNGIVDEAKILEIKAMEYDELKEKLNVNTDFCMYVEDDKGNILLEKGSPKLLADGYACG
jgi:hypothetical protein